MKNVGERKGLAVAQLYVHEVKPTAPRPPKELKGIARAAIQPGGSHTLRCHLDRDSFKVWSTHKAEWIVNAGVYEIQVGESSGDIRLRHSLDLEKGTGWTGL